MRRHASGEVAAAQWANAGVGLLGVVLLMLPLWFPARWNRWWLTVPVAAVFVMAAAGAVGMIVRDALTGSGGTWFGLYCAVWAVLVGATGWLHHRGARSRSAQDGTRWRSASPIAARTDRSGSLSDPRAGL